MASMGLMRGVRAWQLENEVAIPHDWLWPLVTWEQRHGITNGGFSALPITRCLYKVAGYSGILLRTSEERVLYYVLDEP